MSIDHALLVDLAAMVVRDYPTRVLVNRDGEGRPPRRAPAPSTASNQTPSSFGATAGAWGDPRIWRGVAERLWSADWIGITRKPSNAAEPYKQT
jgi:hypothetical protein